MVYFSTIDKEISIEKEYKNIAELYISLEDDFIQKLSDDDRLKYNNILKQINDLNFKMNKRCFNEGFKQGAKLMQELQSTDTN